MKNEYLATVKREYELTLIATSHEDAYYQIIGKMIIIEREIAKCSTQIKSIIMTKQNVA